ncbi:MAG: AAA family ATPase [Coleofasciculus sp. E1-EBD-02]
MDESEEAIFIGIWDEKEYRDIAAKILFSEQHTRKLGADLCKKVTQYLEIRVRKRNFRKQIEYRYKEGSTQQNNGLKFDASTLGMTSPPAPLLPGEGSNLSSFGEDNDSDIINDNIIINPFTPQQGRIDNPQDFFNREREIRQIFEVLNSGSSVALIGVEGVGKSSLLSQIVRLAGSYLHSPRQSVFLDLNTVVDEDDFYGALCDEIGIPESKGARLSRHLKSRQVLLALDNVGKMTWDGFNRGVRDYLRGLAEGSQAPLKLVLAANESLDKLFNDSWDNGKTSPLAGVCQEEIIKPWDEPTARDFIDTRLAMNSIKFTEAEINQLVEESGGHPRRLMQLCYRMYSRYLEGG